MEYSIQENIHFIGLLNKNNKKQKSSLLKNITSKQYVLLKKIIKEISHGKIPLNGKEFNKLRKHKNLLEKIVNNSGKKTNILKYGSLIANIFNIANTHYEKNGFNTLRRVDKNKRKRCKRQRKDTISRRHSKYEHISESGSSSEESDNSKSSEESTNSNSSFSNSSTEDSQEDDERKKEVNEESENNGIENTNNVN